MILRGIQIRGDLLNRQISDIQTITTLSIDRPQTYNWYSMVLRYNHLSLHNYVMYYCFSS